MFAPPLLVRQGDANVSGDSIIYGYFEIAAKEGDMAGLKGMIAG